MSVLTEGRVYGQERPEKDVATYTQMGAGAVQKVCSVEHYSDTSSELSASLREKILGRPGGGRSRNQNYGHWEGTRDGRGYSGQEAGAYGKGAGEGGRHSNLGQENGDSTGEESRHSKAGQENSDGTGDEKHSAQGQGNGLNAEGTGSNNSGVVGQGHGEKDTEDESGGQGGSASRSNSFSSPASSRQFYEKQAQTSNLKFETMGTSPDPSCRCEQWRGKCTCLNCDFSNCRSMELKQPEQAAGGGGNGTRSSDSEQRKGKCHCCNCTKAECIYARDTATSETTASRNIDDFTETSTQTFTEFAKQNLCCSKQRAPRRQRHHQCKHCYRSSWGDCESSSDNSESDESCNMNFMELPYQNNDEYMELLRELESKLVARNRERVRKTRQEFESRSRQNKNLDQPICNYDESCGFDDDNVILEKLKGRGRNKQHNNNNNNSNCCPCCCNRNTANHDQDSDIFQNERRWDSGESVNFVEAVVKSMDPNPKMTQKYPKFERSVRRSHWQMDPKSGEWIKVAAYQHMDYHCPRMCRNVDRNTSPSPQCCRNGGHHRRHKNRQ